MEIRIEVSVIDEKPHARGHVRTKRGPGFFSGWLPFTAENAAAVMDELKSWGLAKAAKFLEGELG